MNLEPQVLTAIRSRKRKIAFQRVLILILVGVMGLITVAMVVWAVVSAGQPGARTSAEAAVGGIVVSAFVDIAMVLSFWYRRSVRDCFEHKVLLPDELARLAKFRNGVEGASLAVGVDLPKGSVFEVEGACYVVFEDDDGKPAIAVNETALYVDLSTEEADAMMAHAVSRILIGDILKPVRKDAPLALFIAVTAECVFITLFVVLAAWGETTRGWNAVFLLFNTPVLIGSIIFVFLVSMGLSNIQWQNLVLADSIAAKITSNPAALRSALQKLHEKDLSGSVSQTDIDVRVGKWKRFGLKRLRPEQFQARMDNLRAIEEGHWHDFE